MSAEEIIAQYLAWRHRHAVYTVELVAVTAYLQLFPARAASLVAALLHERVK
jgi:hypothetical protein